MLGMPGQVFEVPLGNTKIIDKVKSFGKDFTRVHVKGRSGVLLLAEDGHYVDKVQLNSLLRSQGYVEPKDKRNNLRKQRKENIAEKLLMP